jgi:hypothetical protein
MKSTIVIALLGGLGAWVGTANAEEEVRAPLEPASELHNYFTQHVSAPSNAFELSTGMFYTQPFGTLQGGVPMASVATPGVAFDLGGAYRMSPRWAFGASAQFQELTPERNSGARGLTVGLGAAYHFDPYRTSDPWVQAGMGFRALWETRDNERQLTSTGFELGKVTAGVDFHMVEGSTIAPMIGADLNLFLWQDGNTSVAISNPALSTFVFAGVQGRFDFGGLKNEWDERSKTSMR